MKNRDERHRVTWLLHGRRALTTEHDEEEDVWYITYWQTQGIEAGLEGASVIAELVASSQEEAHAKALEWTQKEMEKLRED